ncbi:MAG: hypothetical protein IKH75_00980 [Ruminococcus sp.]|nr:hypothetical protein [Ruminococcus sp.]
MRLLLELEPEEVRDVIDYPLIGECVHLSIWNTGKRRRLYDSTFTQEEKEKIPDITRKAGRWAVYGIKDHVQISVDELALWKKLGSFCLQLLRR